MDNFKSGSLCLDFANSKRWRGSKKPTENIKSYEDLVYWGEQAGIISAECAGQLNQYTQISPEKAAYTYEYAIEAREAIYRIFSNHYAGKLIWEADLSLVNSVACEAMSHLQITQASKGYRWMLPENHEDAILILWNVSRAAVDLLTSEKVARVRECEDDRGCGYLFIDQTKNHSRRWCSMESCGNRAKARRYYSRLQAG